MEWIPPLHLVFQFYVVQDYFIQRTGTKVKNYFQSISKSTRKVYWKKLEAPFLSHNLEKEINEAIEICQVFYNPENDNLIWAPSKSGNYIVKLG